MNAMSQLNQVKDLGSDEVPSVIAIEVGVTDSEDQ